MDSSCILYVYSLETLVDWNELKKGEDMKNKYYVVSLILSIRAESEEKATDEFIKRVYTGQYEADSFEVEEVKKEDF